MMQGMSKDVVIVNDWNYRCVNWVYVVLCLIQGENTLGPGAQLDFNKVRPILNMLGYQIHTEA